MTGSDVPTSRSTAHELSVVVPTYRRASQAAGLAAELLTQPGVAEVVLVADGADPSLRRLAAPAVRSDPRLRVIELPTNVGVALARLAGVHAATSDIVLLLDDDVWPSPGLVSGHLAAHNKDLATFTPAGLVVVGPMPLDLSGKDGRGHVPARIYASEYDAALQDWTADHDKILRGLWLGNVSVRRSDLLAAETVRATAPLRYHEDLDLGLRLRALGLRGAYTPEAAATHRHTRTLAGFAQDAYRRGVAIRELQSLWGEVPVGPRNETEPAPRSPQWLLFWLGAHPKVGAPAAAALLYLAALLDVPGPRPLALAAAKAARVLQLSRGFHAKPGDP